LLAAQPLIALQALRLKGAAIIRIARVISLRGVAIIRTAKAVAASLAILIASIAAIKLVLLLLVLLFNFSISSIMQIDARSLLSF
jgi:hypothetical protein